jgi:hypothetical protein
LREIVHDFDLITMICSTNIFWMVRGFSTKNGPRIDGDDRGSKSGKSADFHSWRSTTVGVVPFKSGLV